MSNFSYLHPNILTQNLGSERYRKPVSFKIGCSDFFVFMYVLISESKSVTHYGENRIPKGFPFSRFLEKGLCRSENCPKTPCANFPEFTHQPDFLHAIRGQKWTHLVTTVCWKDFCFSWFRRKGAKTGPFWFPTCISKSTLATFWCNPHVKRTSGSRDFEEKPPKTGPKLMFCNYSQNQLNDLSNIKNKNLLMVTKITKSGIAYSCIQLGTRE